MASDETWRRVLAAQEAVMALSFHSSFNSFEEQTPAHSGNDNSHPLFRISNEDEADNRWEDLIPSLAADVDDNSHPPIHQTQNDEISVDVIEKSLDCCYADEPKGDKEVFSLPEWFEEENDRQFANDDTRADNDDLDGTNSLLKKLLATADSKQTSRQEGGDSEASMESLAEEVAAAILFFLSLKEIEQVSLVSTHLYKATRSNHLWKRLFLYRWNVATAPVDDSRPRARHLPGSNAMDYDYYNAYRRAHLHPHDLWVTHVNCTFPFDGIAPGRCCIRPPMAEEHSPSMNASKCPSLLSANICPSCLISSRRGRDIHDDPSGTVASCQTNAHVMRDATERVIRKMGPISAPPNHGRARRGFACAATMHRRLRLRQYEPDPTSFATDVLFFNLTDPTLSEGRWDLNQLLQEVVDSSEDNFEDSRPDPLYETSNHSWHILRLFNPDFCRPIVFQVGLQRPDCFTVYPSEGYLAAGQSILVTLGVRPLGSAMAYAMEALNVQRDGLPAPWADLYTEQAHLPLAPILIRYRFALMPPLRPDPVHDPRRRPFPPFTAPGGGPAIAGTNEWQAIRTSTMASGTNASNRNVSQRNVSQDRKRCLDYHFQQSVPAHQMRSIYLSAHVHAHYSFWDFCRATCSPWQPQEMEESMITSIFVSPILREEYPEIFQRLNLYSQPCQPTNKSAIVHTEGPCLTCGLSWGLAEEELAHSYVVLRGECNWQVLRRSVTLRNARKILQLLRSNSSDLLSSLDKHQAASISSLLVRIWTILQEFKASPLVTFGQMRVLVKLEAIADNIYRKIPVGGEDWVPWRSSGLYEYALCTQSVFPSTRLRDNCNFHEAYNDPSLTIEWKEEVDYLDAFRHLAHCPGYYCLGPQEDPNHLLETVVDSSPRYTRKQLGPVTDVFMDDPISALQAGICMMRDPRSLLVHGIYDRVAYPGTVIRRPRMEPFRIKPSQDLGGVRPRIKDAFANLIKSKADLIRYQLHGFVDMESVLDADCEQVDSFVRRRERLPFRSFSLHSYVQNIPPPGVGRFALSQSLSDLWAGDLTGPKSIVPLDLSGGENDEASDGRQNQAAIEVRNRPVAVMEPAPPLANLRGPRFFQLLWMLGARLGLAVIDSPDASSVFVERNILIATQWISISLSAAPLFWTLFARFLKWIPAEPLEYKLEDLPFRLSKEMRFLTDKECGYVAIALFFVWLALGRWSERHTYRDFFRVMLEHISPPANLENQSMWRRYLYRFHHCICRRWDALCPLFIQRRVFAPHWNRRTRDDLMRHIAFWQSRNIPEQRAVVRVIQPDQLFGDSRDEGIDLGSGSNSSKVVIGLVVALGSFCSSSPHFWLNLVTIFSGSISLGMSVSLHSLEKGRSDGMGQHHPQQPLHPHANHTSESVIKAFSLVTVVIGAFLLGQLVGSSGGTMFLAEFIVTSISLVLGGAGTVSASAMENWACFLCLSSTAFWGYLFGRVALMDGVRQKRGGYSSLLLSKAVTFLFTFWVLVFMVSSWDVPANIVIVRPTARDPSATSKQKPKIKLLQ